MPSMRPILLAMVFVASVSFLTGCESDSSPTGSGGDNPLPGAPANITVQPGDGFNTISWTEQAGLTYNLYFRAGPGVTTANAKIDNVSSPFVHSGLNNGTLYSYIVTAVNSVGEGEASSVALGTPQAPPEAAITYVNKAQGYNRWRNLAIHNTEALLAMDADGDGRWGTAGSVFFAAYEDGSGARGHQYQTDPYTWNGGFRHQTLSSIPSYFSVSKADLSDVAFACLGCIGIDHPTRDDPPLMLMGLGGIRIHEEQTWGAVAELTVGTGFPPSGVRVGILSADRPDHFHDVQLVQTAGSGSASASAERGNDGEGVLWYFFDITNASEGDIFTLSISKDYVLDASSDLDLMFGGLVFDELP